MDKRSREKVVACLAIGAAAVALYFAFGRRSDEVNLDAYEVLGVVTAEETAKLIGDKGEVLVMARAAGENPSVDAELKAFTRTLEKRPGVRLMTDQVVVTPMVMMATGGGLPPEQLLRALENRTNLAALVLFFGFPALAEPELRTLEKSGVKTVVVSSFHPGYKRLMERGLIQLAIVPRSEEPAPGMPRPRTVRERFDQTFQLIRPADVARLP